MHTFTACEPIIRDEKTHDIKTPFTTEQRLKNALYALGYIRGAVESLANNCSSIDSKELESLNKHIDIIATYLA